MEFTNAEVRPDELPRFDAVQLQAVHRHYPRAQVLVVMIAACLVMVPLAVVLLVVARALPVLAGLLAFSGAGLLFAWLAWVAHKSAMVIGYAIREHDVIVQSGIFWRKQTIQPITRIQHVEVTRGPLDKRFGLANLRLFSAGTGHLTFQIPGLGVDEAERIKAFILRTQQGGA